MTEPSLDTAAGAVLFANAEWRLLPGGLEHRATGYFIERAVVGSRRGDGLWSWPLQLAEKSWCGPRLFREAFLAAVERFGLARDEALTRSFAVGFGLRPTTGGREGFVAESFVALGDLVRPKPVSRRSAPAEARPAARGRGGQAATGRRTLVGANA